MGLGRWGEQLGGRESGRGTQGGAPSANGGHDRLDRGKRASGSRRAGPLAPPEERRPLGRLRKSPWNTPFGGAPRREVPEWSAGRAAKGAPGRESPGKIPPRKTLGANHQAGPRRHPTPKVWGSPPEAMQNTGGHTKDPGPGNILARGPLSGENGRGDGTHRRSLGSPSWISSKARPKHRDGFPSRGPPADQESRSPPTPRSLGHQHTGTFVQPRPMGDPEARATSPACEATGLGPGGITGPALRELGLHPAGAGPPPCGIWGPRSQPNLSCRESKYGSRTR